MAVAAKKNPFLPDEEGILGKGMELSRGHKATSGCCKVGFILKDGNIFAPAEWGCHASLAYPPANVEYVVNYVNTSQGSMYGIKISQEVKRAFVEWLVNFSPYRSVFVTTDIDSIMKDDFVVASIDHPANLMAGALQALRALSEHPHAGYIWYHLVKAGTHPNIAFYLAYAFRTGNGKTLYQQNSAHTGCWDANSCCSRETLVNILNDKIVKQTTVFRKKHDYQSAQLLFTDNKGESIIPKIVSHIKQVVDGVVPKVSANPFAQPVAPLNKDKWAFDEAIKAIADYVKTEFKKELEKINGKA